MSDSSNTPRSPLQTGPNGTWPDQPNPDIPQSAQGEGKGQPSPTERNEGTFDGMRSQMRPMPQPQQPPRYPVDRLNPASPSQPQLPQGCVPGRPYPNDTYSGGRYSNSPYSNVPYANAAYSGPQTPNVNGRMPTWTMNPAELSAAEAKPTASPREKHVAEILTGVHGAFLPVYVLSIFPAFLASIMTASGEQLSGQSTNTAELTLLIPVLLIAMAAAPLFWYLLIKCDNRSRTGNWAIALTFTVVNNVLIVIVAALILAWSMIGH